MAGLLRISCFGMMVLLSLYGISASRGQDEIRGEALPLILFDEKPFHEVIIPNWLCR